VTESNDRFDKSLGVVERARQKTSAERSTAEAGDELPLADVRIVEMGSFMSAPFATMMLADLGADVIKVEPPRGDRFRRFMRPPTPMSPQFANVNRNKRNVVLNLKEATDGKRLRGLLTEADIFLANMRPDALSHVGLDDSVLQELNPRLIRCYLTGFGKSGPDAGTPAFDAIILARAGVTDQCGVGKGPALPPNYLADTISATMAAQALLTALYARTTTGRGQCVDVSMLDAVSYFNFAAGMAHRTFLDHQVESLDNPARRPTRPIRTRDGWIMVSAVSRKQIVAACAAVSHPEWAEELIADRDTMRMNATLLERLESVTESLATSDCLRLMVQHDVPAAECLDADQHFLDPQVVHNHLYSIEEWPEIGRVRQIRYPASFEGWKQPGPRTPAPKLQ
jgi:crotonobetainyl-CoA:carnitine CoA-transferase CaiB-like acyl-CoA transferase